MQAFEHTSSRASDNIENEAVGAFITSDEGERKEVGDRAERGGREGSYETPPTRN